MSATRYIVLCLVALLVLPGCRTMFKAVEAVDEAVSPDFVETITVVHGDEAHEVLLSHPQDTAAHRLLPAVIHLHGAGSEADRELDESGLGLAASHMGFLAVLPQAGPGGWDVAGLGDEPFLKTLIQELVRNHRVDPQRIYVSGVGNGGAMALKLGCSLSYGIAGVGVVSGAMPVEDCRTAKAVPVIFFHGLADSLVPFEGGETAMGSSMPTTVPPVMDVVEMLAQRNGCQDLPLVSKRGDLVRTAYSGQTRFGDVVLYTLENGGHGWPVRKEGDPGVNLAWIMLDFFSKR